MITDNDEFFVPVFRSALKAGQEIIRVYTQEFDVETKGDGSPITLADRISNDIILEALSKTPYPVISEEKEITSHEKRKSWEFFWLVDPLDGTKEFINKNGEFTVNIALVKKDTPVWGIILAPAIDSGYFTFQENFAYKIEDTSKLTKSLDIITIDNIMAVSRKITSSGDNKQQPQKVLASRSHFDPKSIELIKYLIEDRNQIELVNRGSSLKFGMLAEGLAQYYPRHNQTWEWDTAAGHAILNASGGEILSIPYGNKFVYNKPNLLNGAFFAFASKKDAALLRGHLSL